MKKNFLIIVLILLATALGGLAWLYADIMAYAQHTRGRRWG